MQLEILQMGHPILRAVARRIEPEEFARAEMQTLIDDMVETMRTVNGAGLAAPQIGQSVRICVAEVQANERYPAMPSLPLRVWVNPVITVVSEKPQVLMYEGCLSVHGLRGLVCRPAHIRIDSVDRSGNPQVDEFEGPLAAVAQHECDHLDGVLFVDRADTKSLTFLEEFQRFVPPEQRLRMVE